MKINRMGELCNYSAEIATFLIQRISSYLKPMSLVICPLFFISLLIACWPVIAMQIHFVVVWSPFSNNYRCTWGFRKLTRSTIYCLVSVFWLIKLLWMLRSCCPTLRFPNSTHNTVRTIDVSLSSLSLNSSLPRRTCISECLLKTQENNETKSSFSFSSIGTFQRSPRSDHSWLHSPEL